MTDQVAANGTDQPSGAVLAAHFSANHALGPRIILALVLIFGVLVWLIIAFPHQAPPALTLTGALLYLISTIDRNMLMLRGIGASSMVSISDDDALAVPDDELPVYTVLLPVYQEPEIVLNLLEGVGRIDYPRDKLEILVLVEEDDLDTQFALHGMPISGVRVVIVPHSLPKTKPKACNYGLSLPASRQLITIYDAEDIPDPLQLRRVVVGLLPRCPTTWPACRPKLSTTTNPAEPADPLVRLGVQPVVRLRRCPALMQPRCADSAGGHLEPLPHRPG